MVQTITSQFIKIFLNDVVLSNVIKYYSNSKILIGVAYKKLRLNHIQFNSLHCESYTFYLSLCSDDHSIECGCRIVYY